MWYETVRRSLLLGSEQADEGGRGNNHHVKTLSSFIGPEIARWSKVIKQAGVRAE